MQTFRPAKLDDQLLAIESELRSFAAKDIGPQEKEFHDKGEPNVPLFRKAAEELQIFGATIPEKYGGLGLDAIATVLIHEQFAYQDPAFASVCLAHSTLATHHLAVRGTEEQCREYLPKLMSGEWRAGLAMTTPLAGSAVTSMENTAIRDGDSYVLNGVKQYITNGDGELLLVYAKTPEGNRGISLFIVETDGEGCVQRLNKEKHGTQACPNVEVSFNDYRIPVGNLVGEEGDAISGMMQNLEIERVGLAAISTGIAARCIDEAIGHACQREQGGRTINEYGMVRGVIADEVMRLNNVRAGLYLAAGLIESGKPGEFLYADSAKKEAAEVAMSAGNMAMEVLAGHGYVGGHVVSRFLNASLLNHTAAGGTVNMMRENVARSVGLMPEKR